MNRQTINIGNYHFIAELHKNGTDIPESETSEFLMMRKYDVVGGVLEDTDVYFIQKSVFDEWVSGRSDGSVVWPVCNSNVQEYSDDCSDFNPDYSKDTITDDVYTLFQKGYSGTETAQVKCDHLRIYHPRNKVTINAVVHLDNYINGIHFHYLCRRYTSVPSKTSSELHWNSDFYSEYLEFIVPSVEDLFSGRIFFNEDTAHTVVTRVPIWNETETNELHNEMVFDASGTPYIAMEQGVEEELIYHTSRGTFTTLYYLTIPFMYDTDEWGNQCKYYQKDCIEDIRLNFLEHPLNITMFPYSSVSTRYLFDEDLQSNKDTFGEYARFTLSGRFGFDSTGQPSIISKFSWPKRPGQYYVNGVNTSGITEFESFRESYEYFHNVDFDDYINIRYDETDEVMEDYSDYLAECEQQGVEPTITEDEFNHQCGFEITVASDMNFKNVILHRYIWDSNPDDFTFPIAELFDSWYEIPELVVAKTVFTDRYVGISIPSNIVVLTKEKLKYAIWKNKFASETTSVPPVWKKMDSSIAFEDDDNGDVHTEDGRTIASGDSDTYIEYNKKIEQILMDPTKFNFIDKIRCTVKTVVPEESATGPVRQNTKILYKPVFYRVADLQNIKVRSKLVQNIGINLADYMTKVESFRLVIGDTEITEYARNDIFVIFRVDASILTGTSGTYHILGDDEYLSSGLWSMIS